MFEEGDWNQDGDFDSSDLVFAFQCGRYESAARPLVVEIAAAVDWIFANGDNPKLVSSNSHSMRDSKRCYARPNGSPCP